MNQQWKNIACIALIFALRVFGFMAILPVLAIHANVYSGGTTSTVGWAIGIYGLMQALLQIPMGSWSDRIGRKPVVLLGLSLMLVGSLVAALSTSMQGVILGRALQGAGAIGSTLNAWCADLTTEKMRTKAMGCIGMSIGVTFMLAMVVGPMIVNSWGLPGLFMGTALLAGLAMLLAQFALPQGNLDEAHRHKTTLPELFKTVLANRDLLKLDFGIMVLHAVYTSVFIILPLRLEQQFGHSVPLWLLYLPLLVVAALVSIPGIIVAELKGKMQQVFLLAIALMALVQIGFIETISLHGWLLLMLWLFFTGFTLLEALLPSLASKYAPVGGKGTAMGVYACSQYFGIFLGGVMGGWLNHHMGSTGVFGLGFGLLLVWLMAALTMNAPGRWSQRSFTLNGLSVQEVEAILSRVKTFSGVDAAKWMADEERLYLRVDTRSFKEEACLALLKSK